MEDTHSGLGFVVIDPRFAAGRGEQYTNAHQEDTRRRSGWEDFHEQDDHHEEGEYVAASVQTAIPESNVGFRLLQKMGWSQGKGLGRNEDGIVEPVKAGVDAGVRLGLGKQEEDDHFTNPELIERKRLETEIQANEDEERKKKREALAEREQRIKEEVTEIRKTFYCEVCNKQYEKAMEFEQHLSSYDHHHKKRLVEMRQMHNERTKDERSRKEARAMEKEMAKLQQQIARANQQQRRQQGTPAPPPLPPPSLPPPLPPSQASNQPIYPQVAASSHTQAFLPPLPSEPPPPPPPPSIHTQQAAPGSLQAAPVMSISLGRGALAKGGVGRGVGLSGGMKKGVGRGAGGRGAAQMLTGFGESSSDDEETAK